MSRFIEPNQNGTYRVTIDNPDDCKFMYNEVCCCADSDEVCDFPEREFCKKRCPHFVKEDMKIYE